MHSRSPCYGDNQLPVVPASPNLPHSDAFLNIQSDGKYFAGAGVVVDGQFAAPGILDLSQPITVTVDIPELDAATEALLSFDLIGFDLVESFVKVNVADLEPPPLSSIGGYVYVDANANGQRDNGELPLPGVTVTLEGPVQRSMQTRQDGSYLFDGLPDGAYTIIETQPADYDDGAESLGQPVLGSVENDRFVNVTLSGGIDATDYNFGEQQPPDTSSIAGYVYVDANQNGIRDPQETAIPGVTISLTGTVERTVQTGDDGSYRFEDLPAGTYAVRETHPLAYIDGPDTRGTPVLGQVENDRFFSINVTGGIAAIEYNFGEFLRPTTNTFAGFVFIDGDSDGVKDSGEAAIPGVQITISGPVQLSINTQSDGSYRFEDLPDGQYTISEIQPVGFLDGPDYRGLPALAKPKMTGL